jgi:hypothetical protein
LRAEQHPARANLTGLSAAGYLPTVVDLVAGTVTLLPLATADFHETWYDDTVAARIGGATATVAIDSFRDDGGRLAPPVAPRLIAHVSRCGSTLMANLLRLRPMTMVLKEPDFVTDVAHRIALTSGDVERRRYQELLGGLLAYTCRAAAAAGRTAVVKVTSWTVPIVMACLDDATDAIWLLQWREPAEVVSSNRADPPSWGDGSERGRAARHAVGIDPLGTDDVELYGSVWTRVVETFVASPADIRYRTLAYCRLREDKERSIRAVEAWFGIESAGLPPGYAEESTRYSKGRPAEPFDPAGAHRRRKLDPAAAHRVEELTGPARARLLEGAQHRLF